MFKSLIAVLTASLFVSSALAINVFQIGYNNNSQTEFEQENNSLNDPRFYVHSGDYTSVFGLSGAGMIRSTPEPWISPEATEGFPRALTSGRPVIDIFFQLSPEQYGADRAQIEIDLRELGSGSTHDLKFFLNGTELDTLTGITEDRLWTKSVLFSDYASGPGPQVLSLQRTGPDSTNPWIQIDYIALSIPEPTKALLFSLSALWLIVNRQRKQ